MNRSVSRLCFPAIFALALSTTNALADCVYPKTPADPPVGKNASQDDMLAAMKLTKQYDADVKAYLGCLDTETEAQISNLGADAKPEQIQQVKKKQNLKHNAAVDDLQKYVDAFNVQLRAFKTK